jgi:hypothetical protein
MANQKVRFTPFTHEKDKKAKGSITHRMAFIDEAESNDNRDTLK